MKYCWLIVALFLFAATGRSESPRLAEVEAGWLRVGRADIRIPGDEGTRFSLRDDLDAGDAAYARARFSWRTAPRHYWAITLVPLEAAASGVLPRDTLFVDTEFPAGARAKATYQFNNYRLTYRYRICCTERFAADAGGTLFIRDARVTLESGMLRDSDYNLGLVPLLSLGLSWRLRPGLSLLLDGDALAAPRGRALDVLSALQYTLTDNLEIGLGYRLLEGGADNDDVYTFAMFHHASVNIGWRF